MPKPVEKLAKSKTFWAGIAALVGAGGAYASGDMTTAEATQTAITGLLGIFLRMAIAKIEAR